MKIQIKAISATVVLLSISVLALAAVDGLSVKRQPKEGQTVKLNIKGAFELQGSQATVTAVTDWKVTKVDADGTYTIDENQHDGKASVAGQDIDIPDSTVTSVFNADGSIKELKGDDNATSSGSYRVSNLEAVVDPGKPLSVGDTWTINIKADSKTGVEAVKKDFKVVAEEKVGDIDTIKLDVHSKETSGSDPAAEDGTVWIAKSDGSMVKSEAKWTNVPIPGAPGPISGTMTITRAN